VNKEERVMRMGSWFYILRGGRREEGGGEAEAEAEGPH
jgi:hypothetical protein